MVEQRQGHRGSNSPTQVPFGLLLLKCHHSPLLKHPFPFSYIHPDIKHHQPCSCDRGDKGLPVRMQRWWRCSPRSSPRSASRCRWCRWRPAGSPCRTCSRRWRPCLCPRSPEAPRASRMYRCDIPLSSLWPAEDESCRKWKKKKMRVLQQWIWSYNR